MPIPQCVMHGANPPLPGTLLYQSLGISEVREVGKEHQSKANPKEKPVSSVLCDPAAHLIYLVLMSKFFSYSLSYLFFSAICFIPSSQQLLSAAGYREGFLWKRGRDNGQFLSRKFVLSEREGALKYFNKNDVSFWGCSLLMGEHNSKSICEQIISRPLFNL